MTFPLRPAAGTAEPVPGVRPAPGLDARSTAAGGARRCARTAPGGVARR